MRLLLLNHLHNARQSMRANRMRSFLTMLGVTIGVASITTILALSAGANDIVRTQVDALGGNIAVVRPGAPAKKEANSFSGLASLNQQYAASTLTHSDVTTLEALPHVQTVAPLMVLTGTAKGTTELAAQVPIVATTPELAAVSNLSVSEGQFLDPNLDDATAVIGAQLSVDAFGTEQSIGKTITIKGTSFTIVGVLKRTNQPVNFNSVDFDNAAIINLESGKAFNQGALHIQQIDIQSDSVEHLAGVITNVNKTLLKNHANQVDFTVLSGDEIAQPTSQLFNAIAGASIAIAAISLIVGGIGIMNIMLVNVAERTRELGIRKAVGATNGDIIWQFLIESLAISLLGGLFGYLLGYGTAFVISTFLTFDPIITWEIAIVALSVSLCIGIVFGLYPAIRAARKDPISALRQYE